MWVNGLRPAKSLPLSFAIFFTLICCIPSFGKKPSGNKGSGRSSSPLTISNVGPSSGPVAGGTTVTITGTGFWHSTSVAFGGVAAPTVIYLSQTELQAVTPAHPSGAVTVSVTGRHNQSETLAGGFVYTAAAPALSLSGISPSQGPTTGGTAVTVTGTGFQTGAAVAFGGVQSTAVTVTSSTQINAMSPPESAGTVSITVTGSNSQSASLPSAFTYTTGPSVTSVSPNSGPVTGGTTATILGSGFQSGGSVAFGGITATYVQFISSTEVQAVTPVSPAGTVSVAVSNPNSQTGSLASAFTFYHTVSIEWTASTSSVAGYNVYRSLTSGGPYTKLNSTLLPGTSFADSNVQAGNTYFYVTTAVDGNNVESADSNQAKAIVPSP